MAWRYVLDGVDVSSIASEKTATRVLNGTGRAGCKLPSKQLGEAVPDFAIGESRLKVYDDSNVLWHHGIVWDVNDDGDENTCTTTISTSDPTVLWAKRPARDMDGDFSDPSFLDTYVTGPQILQAILQASEVKDGLTLLDLAGGTFETGGFSLSAQLLDWPVTIADIAAGLFDTGELDIVVEPIDAGYNIGRLHAYNGDYGQDLSGSVVFQFGIGARNVRRAVRTQSMADMVNKLWYLIGPPKKTITDPAGVQHWRANVTGDHPEFSTAEYNPPGGDVSNGSQLGSLILQSRARYWVSMDVQVFDSGIDSGTDAETAQIDFDHKSLRQWQTEQQLRVGPRTLCKITPVRGTEPSFTVGDLIGVQAGTLLRGGFSEVQRVYRLTVNIDDNGVVDLGEILTTADQETL